MDRKVDDPGRLALKVNELKSALVLGASGLGILDV
jgi:hypothetical protein